MKSIIAGVAFLVAGAHGFGMYTDERKKCSIKAMPIPDFDGPLIWVEMGHPMKMWGNDRQLITSTEEMTEAEGTYYTPFCFDPDTHSDGSCVIECKDGDWDYDTYCEWWDPETMMEKTIGTHFCRPYRETRLNTECTIDWTSDDVPPNGATQSYKEIWNKTLENMYLRQDVYWQEGFFNLPPINAPNDPTGFPVTAEAFLNTLGFGWSMLHAFSYTSAYPETPVDDIPFSNEMIYAAYYTPDVNNATTFADASEFPGFGPDPMGSTVLGDIWMPNGFGFNLSTFPALQATTWPNWGLLPTVVLTPLIDSGTDADVFDPCVWDSKYGGTMAFGMPSSCFIRHAIGSHYVSGNMFPYYPPLKDGTLDFFGVCTSSDIDNDGINRDAQKVFDAYPESSFSTLAEDFGGLDRPHAASGSLHLCIDWTDPEGVYEPFACLYNPTVLKLLDFENFWSIDPMLFFDYFHTPWNQCTKQQEGLCDWGEEGPPLDWPREWSPDDY